MAAQLYFILGYLKSFEAEITRLDGKRELLWVIKTAEAGQISWVETSSVLHLKIYQDISSEVQLYFPQPIQSTWP